MVFGPYFFSLIKVKLVMGFSVSYSQMTKPYLFKRLYSSINFKALFNKL